MIIQVPRCPKCGSTNIEKVSAAKKAVGAFGFGLFSKTAKKVNFIARITKLNSKVKGIETFLFLLLVPTWQLNIFYASINLLSNSINQNLLHK